MSDKNEVTIKWLGHSCFLVYNDAIRIITDPYDETLGYPLPEVSAEVCLVSHDHFDHNYVSMVKGNPQVIKGTGEKEVGLIKFKGVASFHDKQEGSRRGNNTIFTWVLGGINFVHLGDLGTELSSSQIKEIGPADILFVPTGGIFTIDAVAATRVVASLNPKVAIPMHYRMPFRANDSLASVDEFLKGKGYVVKVGKNSIVFSKSNLPEKTTIYVLEYGK